jgi:hypothetical protein
MRRQSGSGEPSIHTDAGPKREGATGARIDHSEQETQIRLKAVASLAPNNQVSHPY